jgi:hypothetical protein
MATLLPIEEDRIIRCLNYLGMIIGNSEIAGTHGLKPHIALSQSKLINLKFNSVWSDSSDMMSASYGYKNEVDIEIDAGSTLQELKKAIVTKMFAEKEDKTESKVCREGHPLHTAPNHITHLAVCRGNITNPFKDSENGKTLEDLGF